MPRLRLLPLSLLLACAPAGSPWDDPDFVAEAREVVERYASLVSYNYGESLRGAEQLQTLTKEFVAAPSEAGLTAVKAAWLGARDSYGRTEAYRFYGGPIDAEPDNLEARINPWPLDERYIDAIIADAAAYPTIDRALLVERNGAEGEDSISAGWHAIEYLLWGVDTDPDGPGARPVADFTDPDLGARRLLYLAVATELLLGDLDAVAVAWSEGQPDYRTELVAEDPHDALTKVLLGLGSLSGAELSGERMTVAFETREQEDEHSCFSDNTHNDLIAAVAGIQAVYTGRIGDQAGPSLSSLVARVDPDLDALTRARLQAAFAAVGAIPPPFDAAIQAPDDSPARQSVAGAIQALRDLTTSIVAVADRLEIQLNLEE